MGRTAGRSPEQTRRQVLDAAATVIRHRGTGATLDEIASAAELSKGGLLYHFSSKDALLRALVQDLLAEFRNAVTDAIGPRDDTPGRLTRAYIRVSFDPTLEEPAARERMALIAQLFSEPGVLELVADDSRRWQEDLGADGLPDRVLGLVIAAADGAVVAPLWGGSISPAARDALRDQLLALTLSPASWDGLPS